MWTDLAGENFSMTEIGLILLGVIVVGGLLAFFLLRTKRDGETQTGPRTVADLVRLKAEESGNAGAAAGAQPAAPTPAVTPTGDVVGTEGSRRATSAAAGPAAATASPDATTSDPADSRPAAGPVAAPADPVPAAAGTGAAVAAGGVAVAAAAAAAATGRGAAASPSGSTPASASPGLPQPRPRTTQTPPAAPAAPAAEARTPEPELEPEAAPAGPVDRSDVSPPWGRIPDGSLVLPAAAPVEPTPSDDQPDWRWLAPVGDRPPAARTAPNAPPAPAAPPTTGTARHAAGRSRPTAVAGPPAPGTPDLPAPRPVARTVRLADPAPETTAAAASGTAEAKPDAAKPDAATPAAEAPAAEAPTPISRAGRATAWFEPTRPADEDTASTAASGAEKPAAEPTSKAPSVAAIVAGAAAAAGGVVVGLRPKPKPEPAEPAADATASTPEDDAPRTAAPAVATGASIASLVADRGDDRTETPDTPAAADKAEKGTGSERATDPEADALAGFSDWADIDDSESDKSVERPAVKDPTPAFGLAAIAPAPAATTEPATPRDDDSDDSVAAQRQPAVPTAEPESAGATGPAVATGGTAAAGLAGAAAATRSTNDDPTSPTTTAPAEPAAEAQPAAAPAVPDNASVRFRVVGRDGDGLQGATVRLLDGRGQGIAEATTGADGRGSLAGPSDGDADGFVVVASAAGHQPTVTAISGDASGDEIALVLATSSAVAGRVRDAAGRPVGGASVSLIEEGEVVDSTRTAATGDYRIGDLPSGEYTVAVTAPRHDPVAVPVKVEPGATATQDVVLDPVTATLGG